MTDNVHVITRPPSFRGMRIAGIVFLGIAAFGAWDVARGDLADLWTSPAGAILSFPFLIGVMLTWVGFSNDKMRRPLAHITPQGAQVGVHKTLPWDQVVRIERRGSGTYETLTLFPDGKRELRRPIPIGRASVPADALVEEVFAHLDTAGRTVTETPVSGARRAWSVGPKA